MGIKFEVDITGLDDLKAELSKASSRSPSALALAVFQEGVESIFNPSQEIVPVDTGRLRSSGRVDHNQVVKDLEVSVSYDTDYAVFVHERTDIPHQNGESKFLEKPFKEAMDGIEARIAKRTADNVSRKRGLSSAKPVRGG